MMDLDLPPFALSVVVVADFPNCSVPGASERSDALENGSSR